MGQIKVARTPIEGLYVIEPSQAVLTGIVNTAPEIKLCFDRSYKRYDFSIPIYSYHAFNFLYAGKHRIVRVDSESQCRQLVCSKLEQRFLDYIVRKVSVI